MRKLATGVVLFVCAIAAALGQAGQTTIIASHIAYFGGVMVTGNFCLTPTNQAGQPINIVTLAGQQIYPQVPLCFPIVAGTLSNTAIVPDTSTTQPVNSCYQAIISNSYGQQVAVYNCIQPSTSTWSFDSYIPSSTPTIPVLALPQFQLNGVPLSNQAVVNFACSGCSLSAGGFTIPTSGSLPSIAANTLLGNNTGLTAAAAALTASQVNTLLGLGTAALQASSAFDAAGAATAAQTASAQKANNLSDLASAPTARTNLGLGSAAQQASSAFDAAGAATTAQGASAQKSSNLSDLASIPTARANLGVPTFAPNPQTATYQVLAADFAVCKTIPVSSGTFTITLVASTSQPATGQCILVLNYGTGVVTIARSGQNLNGGVTSLTLAAGSASAPTGAWVVSDGTNYEAGLWGAPTTTATNLSGSSVDSAPYQSASATTSYIPSPTTSGHTFFYAWQPAGSAVVPAALDFTNFMATPPPIGATTPSSGAFTTLSATSFSVGSSPPAACGSATGCWASKEASTAGTPTAGQDYIRADSTTHSFIYSINGGAEASLPGTIVAVPTPLTAQAANLSFVTIYTTPAANHRYMVCGEANLTRPATTSSTMVQIQIGYTSAIDSAIKIANIGTTPGIVSNSTLADNSGCVELYILASTTIQWATVGYVSTGATTMQFSLAGTVQLIQ